MSQPPDDDRTGRENDPEQPPPWPASPPGGHGDSAYPYAPQPWGPDPEAPSPSPAPQDYSSSAYGTGGYPPGPRYEQPGYDQPGHDQAGYHAYGQASGYGLPPARSAEQSSVRTQGTVALVLNIVSALACCNVLGIVGAVLAGISLGKVDQDLPHAKNLIKWSWVLLGTGVALAFALVAFLLLAGFAGVWGY